MARKLETHTNWENADHRLHEERELPATEARQGNMGRRVLVVLVVALILTAIVWVVAEISADRGAGATTSATATPGQITTDMPAPSQTPSVQGNSQQQ